MRPAAKPAAAPVAAAARHQHTAAIHVLRSRLGLSEDDYRHVLRELTGKASCSEMSVPERAKVREHLQRQAQRLGVAGKPGRPGRAQPLTPEQFAHAKREARPKERKVWAMWHALHRAGHVEHADQATLDAWVARTVHVSALRFATDAQLHTLIEALKQWLDRPAIRNETAAEAAARRRSADHAATQR